MNDFERDFIELDNVQQSIVEDSYAWVWPHCQHLGENCLCTNYWGGMNRKDRQKGTRLQNTSEVNGILNQNCP